MDVREKLVYERVELADIISYAMRDWDNYIDECRETETPPIDGFEDFIADGILSAGYRNQEWISVKDRLPERTLPPKDVLVYHDLGCGMFIDRAWYSYDEKRWCSVLGIKLKVTHWMPLSDLPQPPKGE